MCKFRNYYHEECDSFESFDDSISTNYKYNILVCWRTGTGKSSFYESIFRGEKECEVLSVSYNKVIYSVQNYPINISDTPGLESEKTVKKVKRFLETYNKKLNDAKKLIIFVMNFVTELIEKNYYKRIKLIF